MKKMATDESMDDEVFEATEENISSKLKVLENDHRSNRKANTPSPTGYRDYKPPAEVLKLCETDVIEDNEQTIHKVSVFRH